MAPRPKPSKSRKTQLIELEGREIRLSNLEKVLYPESGFTKAQVIDYYVRISTFILPHLKDRPITLKRYPDGVSGETFYEKDVPSFTPAWVKTFPIWRRSGESQIRYILINDLPTLVWAANLACLEMHPFLARAPKIDQPTHLVFDLDPGESADILTAAEASLLLRELLTRLKLKAFAKVSGSKGVHVHVPLNAPMSYAVTQPFAQAIAKWLEREHPKLMVSEMGKEKRKGKIFVDWSQNADYKSTVSVYSLRAKREAPFVAMPVTWEEIKRAAAKGDKKPLFFEPEEALRRLDKIGDLFAPTLKLNQNLPDQPGAPLKPKTARRPHRAKPLRT